MPKSFTPWNSALVLLDHQVGTLRLIRTRSAGEALRSAAVLATAPMMQVA